MPPRLILNADDFGLTRGVNRAIAELHHAGALTSATLMANGSAFDDAVATAHANPTLGVGCHVVLTDGTPVSPPNSIPTLLGPDGATFRPKLTTFIRDLLLGRISESDIEREALAQLHKLQAAGITVTHLDTHKHTHIFPTVARTLVRIITANHIAIRNPFEPMHIDVHAPLKRRLEIAALDRFKPTFNRIAANALRPDGTFGISATGSLDSTTLHQLLSQLPPTGTFELLCHPGYNDADLASIPTRLRSHRETERRALLSAFSANSPNPSAPHLINYGDLNL
jgi:predicted glycoside hydrolase/deacetylase ChbG (UPF0249 family)